MVSLFSTARSAAHSTCRGEGWYTWRSGLLRSTEHTAPSSTVPRVVAPWAGAVMAPVAGPRVGSTANRMDLPVLALRTSIRVGAPSGAPGDAGGTRWSTIVASPRVDTLDPTGTSSLRTGAGNRSTFAAPVMYTV